MVAAEVEEVASMGTVEGEADAVIQKPYDLEKRLMAKVREEPDMT